MATLTVTITENVTLNGKERGSENTLEITGVNQTMGRIVSTPADGGGAATQTTIANFRTAVTTADSAMDDDDVKYVRVTNLDETNQIILSLQIAANGDADADSSASILLGAKQSFIVHKGVGVTAVDDDAATAVTVLKDLESIIAINDNNVDVDVEVFVASA